MQTQQLTQRFDEWMERRHVTTVDIEQDETGYFVYIDVGLNEAVREYVPAAFTPLVLF